MSELGPVAREIVEGGRYGDEPAEPDRARVRASLMQAIVAGGGSSAAAVGKTAAAGIAPQAPAGTGVGASIGGTAGRGVGASIGGTAGRGVGTSIGGAAGAGVGAKFLALVLLVSVAGGGAYAWTRSSESGAPPAIAQTSIDTGTASAAASRIEAAESASSPSPAIDSRAPVLPDAREPRREPTESASPSRSTPPPARTSATATATASADPLESEARLLHAAHDAIQAGDAERALADLDAQSRAYSQGQLTEERAAARVLALCQLGRVDEAKAAAARFIVEHPRSPHVDRLRAPCAEKR